MSRVSAIELFRRNVVFGTAPGKRGQVLVDEARRCSGYKHGVLERD